MTPCSTTSVGPSADSAASTSAGSRRSADTLSGKLREPVVRFVQWARTVGVSSTNTKFEIYDLSGSDAALGQSALRSPSVFNFFRPGYVPPNTGIAIAGKQAPEFQLLNETTSAGYINFMQWVTRGGYNDVKPTYSALLPVAHDVPAVAGIRQHGRAVAVLGVDVHAFVEELLHGRRVTLAGGLGQGVGLLARRGRLRRGRTRAQQHEHRADDDSSGVDHRAPPRWA